MILAGYNQDPPPPQVVHGEPSDPPNLWTGVCGPVAVTLRDKNNYVDLSGLARMRWVTRVSGFHVVRPVVKLADGTLLIGDHRPETIGQAPAQARPRISSRASSRLAPCAGSGSIRTA